MGRNGVKTQRKGVKGGARTTLLSPTQRLNATRRRDRALARMGIRPRVSSHQSRRIRVSPHAPPPLFRRLTRGFMPRRNHGSVESALPTEYYTEVFEMFTDERGEMATKFEKQLEELGHLPSTAEGRANLNYAKLSALHEEIQRNIYALQELQASSFANRNRNIVPLQESIEENKKLLEQLHDLAHLQDSILDKFDISLRKTIKNNKKYMNFDIQVFELEFFERLGRNISKDLHPFDIRIKVQKGKRMTPETIQIEIGPLLQGDSLQRILPTFSETKVSILDENLIDIIQKTFFEVESKAFASFKEAENAAVPRVVRRIHLPGDEMPAAAAVAPFAAAELPVVNGANGANENRAPVGLYAAMGRPNLNNNRSNNNS